MFDSKTGDWASNVTFHIINFAVQSKLGLKSVIKFKKNVTQGGGGWEGGQKSAQKVSHIIRMAPPYHMPRLINET